MTMKSFKEVQTDLQALAESDWSRFIEMRQIASADLELELREWLGDDHGQGISSSDVSCHLIEMVRFGELAIDNDPKV
jgi:hypothetical protein